MTEAASSRPRASDRATVERTVRDLIFGVVGQHVPAGTSIVLEGAPGIGTRLFVSPRTVQVHVSHILQKTGLRSRVEIARSAGA